MLGSEPKKRFHEAVLVPEPSKRFANISNCQKRFFQNVLQTKFTHTGGGFKKTPSFHQSFKTLGDIQQPGENLVIFEKKHQVFQNHDFQKPGENLVIFSNFTRFSPGFENHHVFNDLFKLGDFSKPGENLVIFFKNHQVFTKFLKNHHFQTNFTTKTLIFHQNKSKNASFADFRRCKTLVLIKF